MAEIEEKVIETVLEGAVEKLSPTKRVWAFLKTLFKAFVIFRWVGSGFMMWFDNIRRAGIISVMDRYPENKVWKTIMWIKTWRLIYGIIIGLLLAYYLTFDETAMEFVEDVIDLFK